MAPQTYHQQYAMLVFAVKFREAMLVKSIRPHVFKYMSGIITNMGEKSIIVGGVANHVHVLVGFRPVTPTADIARVVKTNSTNHIKRNIGLQNFAWQEGYGVFTYSRSQINKVYDYILYQEERHRNQTFRQEYMDLLQNFEIEHREDRLFDWLPDEEV